jgi:hypothetical protein
MADINSRIFDLFEDSEHFSSVTRSYRERTTAERAASRASSQETRASSEESRASSEETASPIAAKRERRKQMESKLRDSGPHMPVKTLVPKTRTSPEPSRPPPPANESTRRVLQQGASMQVAQLMDLLSSDELLQRSSQTDFIDSSTNENSVISRVSPDAATLRTDAAAATSPRGRLWPTLAGASRSCATNDTDAVLAPRGHFNDTDAALAPRGHFWPTLASASRRSAMWKTPVKKAAVVTAAPVEKAAAVTAAPPLPSQPSSPRGRSDARLQRAASCRSASFVFVLNIDSSASARENSLLSRVWSDAAPGTTADADQVLAGWAAGGS